jgi:hypothetical protein
MKATQLIETLTKLVEKYGDQDVVLPLGEEFAEGADDNGFTLKAHSVAVGFDKENNPYEFQICDKETAVAFS